MQNLYDDSDSVWFFVNVRYRIQHFNKKAAGNSILFHNKELAAGDSILDYARDTNNDINEDFIRCFGRSASGQEVSHEQHIVFNDQEIWARSSYTPVYEDGKVLGVSILVEDITGLRQEV